jgi:hypothetical protein
MTREGGVVDVVAAVSESIEIASIIDDKAEARPLSRRPRSLA